MSKKHDLFFSNEHVLKRLIEEYNKGEDITIAFDYDDTIYGYYDADDEHTKIIEIVKWVQELNFKTILFTVREEEYLDSAIAHLTELGIHPTYVNENPIVVSRKPFFHLLLDDRCGLKQSYECLHQFLTYIEKNHGSKQRKGRN